MVFYIGDNRTQAPGQTEETPKWCVQDIVAASSKADKACSYATPIETLQSRKDRIRKKDRKEEVVGSTDRIALLQFAAGKQQNVVFCTHSECRRILAKSSNCDRAHDTSGSQPDLASAWRRSSGASELK